MYIRNNDCNVNGISWKIGIIFFVFLLVFPLYGQVKTDEPPKQMEEYPLKVWIISRFLDFVKWPSGAGTNRADRAAQEFVVGIIGDSPMSDYKKTFYEKIRLPGKTLVVKNFTALEEIEGCHVLIIGDSESKRLEKILALTETKPILSIGDTEGFGARGVLINLYTSGRKVKFEINLPSVKKSGLNFSSKLYKLARIIR